MTLESESAPRLRRWLRANAAFSALSGSALLAFSRILPGTLGVGTPWVYAGVGAGLVLYAVHLWRVAGGPLGRADVGMIVGGDVAWVLGSVALVASGALAPAGVWIVAGVALVIGLFAVMQWRGWRSARPGAVSR